MRVQDIILGKKYNKIIPKYLTLEQTSNGKNRTYAVCDCECGKKDFLVLAYNIGRNISCGCENTITPKKIRKIKFKHKIDDIIENEKINVIVTARKITHIDGQYTKYYKIKCNNCGFDSNNGCYYTNSKLSGKYVNEYWVNERNIHCPCCNNPTTAVQFGINSIYDTDYWMVKYFRDKELPKRITSKGSTKRELECPYCHEVKNKSLVEVYKDHSIGCICSKGKSYYERYFGNICKQLSEKFGYEYKHEITPEWCIFPNYNGNGLRKGKYDYQPDVTRNIYVELDGDFHREDNNMNGQTVEESQYIDNQKDILANKNGYINIRILCDDKNKLKDRILNSPLSKYFDLSYIDFNKAAEFAEGQMFDDICNDKNNGLSIKQISDKYGISDTLTRRKIKIGVELGKCNYNPDQENAEIFRRCGKENWKYMKDIIGQCNKKPIEISKDNCNWVQYESEKDLIDVSQEKYGHKFQHSGISRVCNGVRNTYYGYYIRFAS